MSRTYVSVALTRLVTERANGQCEYCRSLSKYTTASFSFALDHIVPESVGGLTAAENLALSCVGCNTNKEANMIAYRIDAKLTKDEVLLLQDLPFRASDNVEVIILGRQAVTAPDADDTHFEEWKMASNRSLQEIWDNDEDAAYDEL